LISTVPRPSVTQLAELPEAECLQLLERRNLGRIALVVDGQPRIFPVNYSMNGRIIAFRTGAGDILAHAPDSKVAFEIDDFDASRGTGWSVMIEGIARDATESFDDVSWAARGTAPEPVAPGSKPFWVAIEPSRITGRRFGPGPA